MSDHTPGPYENFHRVIRHGDKVIATVWSKHQRSDSVDVEEAEANARLFAKAWRISEMLESLKELVDCLESIMRRQAWGKPIEKAHALIAELEDE